MLQVSLVIVNQELSITRRFYMPQNTNNRKPRGLEKASAEASGSGHNGSGTVVTKVPPRTA